MSMAPSPQQLTRQKWQKIKLKKLKNKNKTKIYGYGNKEWKQRKKSKILEARGNLAGIFIKRGQASDKEIRGNERSK